MKSFRFRKRLSERSGFEYPYNSIIYDDGHFVGPDEFDTPPPSDVPLGGEGDQTMGEHFRTDYTSYGVTSSQVTKVQYLTSSSTIAPIRKSDEEGERNFNQSIVYISGSLATVNLATNPQISAGAVNDKITIQCVGSNVILENGSGLSLRKILNMDSGTIINLIYDTGDTVWVETSRSHLTKNLGEF
jgi:hypothetical protein